MKIGHGLKRKKKEKKNKVPTRWTDKARMIYLRWREVVMVMLTRKDIEVLDFAFGVAFQPSEQSRGASSHACVALFIKVVR